MLSAVKYLCNVIDLRWIDKINNEVRLLSNSLQFGELSVPALINLSLERLHGEWPSESPRRALGEPPEAPLLTFLVSRNRFPWHILGTWDRYNSMFVIKKNVFFFCFSFFLLYLQRNL